MYLVDASAELKLDVDKPLLRLLVLLLRLSSLLLLQPTPPVLEFKLDKLKAPEFENLLLLLENTAAELDTALRLFAGHAFTKLTAAFRLACV